MVLWFTLYYHKLFHKSGFQMIRSFIVILLILGLMACQQDEHSDTSNQKKRQSSRQ